MLAEGGATPMPAPKPAWQSKTILTNVAAMIGALANGRYDLAILAAVNIALRFVTKEPVTLDPQSSVRPGETGMARDDERV